MHCQNPLQCFKMLTYCILNCGNFCWILKTTKPTSFDKLILFYIHWRIQSGGGALRKWFPLGPIYYSNFMQFSGKMAKIVDWCRGTGNWCTLREIMDPPLCLCFPSIFVLLSLSSFWPSFLSFPQSRRHCRIDCLSTKRGIIRAVTPLSDRLPFVANESSI